MYLEVTVTVLFTLPWYPNTAPSVGYSVAEVVNAENMRWLVGCGNGSLALSDMRL